VDVFCTCATRLIHKLQVTKTTSLDVEQVVGHCLASKIRTAYKVTDRADRVRFLIEVDQRLKRLPPPEEKMRQYDFVKFLAKVIEDWAGHVSLPMLSFSPTN